MTEERSLLKAVAMALREVENPTTGVDLITAGKVRSLSVAEPNRIRFKLLLGPNDPPELEQKARAAAESVEGVEAVEVEPVRASVGGEGGSRKLPMMEAKPAGSAASQAPGPPGRPTPPQPQAIPGVRRVIAVSSGKGGVGKSTIATNLACALKEAGHAVGLMDADVYGPNIPIMFGAFGRPQVTQQERIVPLDAHGVRLMSIGFLVDEDTPAIWRGPIVMGVIRQFLHQVDWGELDFLVVDMPPGTGDAQLSLVQLVEVNGAVLVTTPQEVATADVLKGIRMFERVEVPVLGVIENMSGFVCPHCGEATDLFGRGGGKKLAATAGVPFLGEVPLGPAMVKAADTGRPTVLSSPDSPESQALKDLASRIVDALAELDAERRPAGKSGS